MKKIYKLQGISETGNKYETYFKYYPTVQEINDEFINWGDIREMDEEEVQNYYSNEPNYWINRCYLHHDDKLYYNQIESYDIQAIYLK